MQYLLPWGQYRSEFSMRKTLFALVLGIPLMTIFGPTFAKGCLKGAAVGGVAGHVAGGHGVVGAAAGCAIEHHREKVADKKVAGAARRSAAAQAASAPLPASK